MPVPRFFRPPILGHILSLLGALTAAGLIAGSPAASLLKAHDVVGLVGGGAWVAEQREGFIEAALRAARPDLKLRFRNFAWEGDTVSQQPRDLNYPDPFTQLGSHGVTITFVQFGQNESWAGDAGVAEFRTHYLRLLENLNRVTPRLILVTPTRFEAKPPPGPNLAARNADLARYAAVIREIATQQQFPLVDLFALTPDPGAVWTTDGRQLSPAGHQSVAAAFVANVAPHPGQTPPASPTAAFRAAVVAKNQLWVHHVRPTNWAFLAGDRTEQPSSHDHRDRSILWFPGEITQFGVQVQEADRQIDSLARNLTPPSAR